MPAEQQPNAEPRPLIADTPMKPEHASPPDEGGVPGSSLQFPVHVHARGLALGVVATVAFVFALQWAKNFLVPLLLGIFIAYTLNPLVVWLERLRIRRMFGATIVTAVMLLLMAGVVVKVQDQFVNILEELPEITHKLANIVSKSNGKPGALAQVQAAATELEQATAAVTGDGRRPPQKKPAAAQGPSIRIMDWVLAGSLRMVSFVTEATMVVFLVYFLLLAGDTFKRKLVKLTGPSLSQKKITVHILEDINTSIQNYMFMLLVTNLLLALLMWLALYAIGLENAGAWAVSAGLLHLMPYFGPLLITSATGLVAFMQFESLQMVLLVAGASLAIATLVGTVVTTWMTGKIARMNAAAVFISLLFWGWLWGVWGLLLGVPVVVIIKVVAERVEGMEVVAELLGE